MSSDHKHEIVIIRRGGHGDHDEHHGGVWKIAFADFMTAMMAFFLVMWLISANDKTRASVARYFNPVRLVDATTQPPGLKDPKKDDSGITASPDTKDTKGPSKEMSKEAKDKKPEGPQANETPSGRQKRLDTTMRDNPLAALAEIAGSQGASDEPSKETARASAAVIGRKGGSAFRDPFAPPPPMARVIADDDQADLTLAPKTPPAAQRDPAADGKSNPAAKSKLAQDNSAAATNPAAEAKTEDLAEELAASVKASIKGGAGPALDVRATKEGVLVSLTDTGSYSMFTNGSAVPTKRVVLMMERVAKILASKPGSLVIRGFTDNKRFRSARYDNWNLSVDRAQAAHYMLVRGGLPDDRIASVEGFADKQIKAGVDPASPLNRRIEILLKDEAK